MFSYDSAGPSAKPDAQVVVGIARPAGAGAKEHRVALVCIDACGAGGAAGIAFAFGVDKALL